MKFLSIKVPKGEAVNVVGDVSYVSRTTFMAHDIVFAAFTRDEGAVLRRAVPKAKEHEPQKVYASPQESFMKRRLI